jgi:hypothetical protein
MQLQSPAHDSANTLVRESSECADFSNDGLSESAYRYLRTTGASFMTHSNETKAPAQQTGALEHTHARAAYETLPEFLRMTNQSTSRPASKGVGGREGGGEGVGGRVRETRPTRGRADPSAGFLGPASLAKATFNEPSSLLHDNAASGTARISTAAHAAAPRMGPAGRCSFKFPTLACSAGVHRPKAGVHAPSPRRVGKRTHRGFRLQR